MDVVVVVPYKRIPAYLFSFSVLFAFLFLLLLRNVSNLQSLLDDCNIFFVGVVAAAVSGRKDE